MQNQNKKIVQWLLGGGLIFVVLLIPEMLIAELLSKNNPEDYRTYFSIMLFATALVYIFISIIKIVKYEKYAKKYESEKLEKVNKELTTEFKQVFLNYSEPISEDLFNCQAKINDNGKIICKIQLDYEVEIESHEKFLRHFHFKQEE